MSNYSTQQILNATFDGTGLTGLPSTQQILNAVFDDTQDALRIKADGLVGGSTNIRLAIWSDTPTYPINSNVILESNGYQYRALTENTNKNPSTNPTDWKQVVPDPDLAAASIKTIYESNANTNAFTDAEKAKLAIVVPEGIVNHGSTGGTVNLDYSSGTVHTITPNATTTFTVSNIPTTHKSYIEIRITNGAGQTVNFPSANWNGGTEPELSSNIDTILFVFYGSASIVDGYHVGVNLQ